MSPSQISKQLIKLESGGVLVSRQGSRLLVEHPDSNYYVEFPPGPLAVGGQEEYETLRRALRRAAKD